MRFGETPRERVRHVISFALHRDFTLTDRSAQKGVLAAPDRASFSDVADCGCGVTLSLLPPKDRGSMNRILCSLLVATLPFGSVLAQSAEVEERQGDPRLPAAMEFPE